MWLRRLFWWWYLPEGAEDARGVLTTATGALGGAAAVSAAAGASDSLRLALAALALLGGVAVLVLLQREHRLTGAWLRSYLWHLRWCPPDRVPGASFVGEVVGRDELCEILVAAVRDRAARRPQLLLGRPGAGKTAVLVRLAQLCAERRLVPLPIALLARPPGSRIDLLEEARSRFFAQARGLVAEGEVEQSWRRLVATDRIVLLVDDVEETLTSTEGEAGEAAVRQAFLDAARTGLPVVAASRPVAPGLWDVGASVVELGPVGRRAALAHLERGLNDDPDRLAWITDRAELAEAPAYLRMARDLHEADLLLTRTRSDDHAPSGADRPALRLSIVRAWVEALAKGHLLPELQLSLEDRRAAIAQLSALACLALKGGGREVGFEDDGVSMLVPESQARSGDRQGSPMSPRSRLLGKRSGGWWRGWGRACASGLAQLIVGQDVAGGGVGEEAMEEQSAAA